MNLSPQPVHPQSLRSSHLLRSTLALGLSVALVGATACDDDDAETAAREGALEEDSPRFSPATLELDAQPAEVASALERALIERWRCAPDSEEGAFTCPLGERSVAARVELSEGALRFELDIAAGEDDRFALRSERTLRWAEEERIFSFSQTIGSGEDAATTRADWIYTPSGQGFVDGVIVGGYLQHDFNGPPPWCGDNSDLPFPPRGLHGHGPGAPDFNGPPLPMPPLPMMPLPGVALPGFTHPPALSPPGMKPGLGGLRGHPGMHTPPGCDAEGSAPPSLVVRFSGLELTPARALPQAGSVSVRGVRKRRSTTSVCSRHSEAR